MLVSYTWLQTYFDTPLPPVDTLVDILTMGVFEIEGVEKKGDDTVLDVKVLPDRGPYGYSHRYIAQEIAALINQPMKFPAIKEFMEAHTKRSLDVSIIMKPDDEVALCTRYIGRVIEGVKVCASPDWLRGMLETLGQRSINTIVDLTNYVMLETGQPLHAFDADKVEGDIVVRRAREGEELIILDGSIVKLSTDMLVIADNAGPLALAGIKGGKRAEITDSTTAIILEAACFDSTNTRRTAQKVGIRNESSKRFEQGVTPERAGLAMAMATSLIVQENPTAIVGGAIDVYPNPVGERILEISIDAINNRLGLILDAQIAADILCRCGVPTLVSEQDAHFLLLSVPPHRPDLCITEDIVEEIARVHGLDKIVGIVPPVREDRKTQKNFYYTNFIRRILADIGFSEIYTHSLIEKGDMAIQNPLTVERAYMRNTISELLSRTFLFNMRNLDLLGRKDIRLFEIGAIFSDKRERRALAFGVGRPKPIKGAEPKAEMVAVASHIFHLLGASDDVLQHIASKITFTELKGDAQTTCVGMVAEIELDAIIDTLPEPFHDIDLGHLVDSIAKGTTLVPISPYPFSSRDVAVFVPGEQGRESEGENEGESKVRQCIENALTTISARELLRTCTLFDVFTKRTEGEPSVTSYGFRLVFQSNDKTLTEEEVVTYMKAVTDALNAHEGWKVR